MIRSKKLVAACVVLAAGAAVNAQVRRSGGLVGSVDPAVSYDPTWEVEVPQFVIPSGAGDGAACWNSTATQCWEGKMVGIGHQNPQYPLHVATNGQWAGVFQGVGANSRGVFGTALATTGVNYGGFFTTASTSGVGVFGKAVATSGVNIGVKGESSSPSGWAGYFVGNQFTTGDVSIGSGSLLINTSPIGAGFRSVIKGANSLIWDGDLAFWKTGEGSDWRIRRENSRFFIDEFGNGRHFTIAPGGNVGIGNDAHDPNVKLDVAGDIKMRTLNQFGNSNKFFFGEPGEGTDSVYFQRVNSSANNSTLYLVIGDDPNAAFDTFDIYTEGVGTRFSFWSTGDALKVGSPGWSSISDARLKHDIEPLTGSLERMLQLQGRTFYYNDPNELGAAPGKRTGFIAQEVEKVFPDWVGEAKGHKTLTISGFEALTVESLRELRAEKDAQVAALQADNESKQQQIDDLAARVKRLEELLGAPK